MKSALITGSSRGVGRATARLLGARGYSLILLGRDSAARRESESSLREAGVPFSSFACDLADLEAVDAVARLVLDDVGAPDVLIHNAGIVERASIATMSSSSWHRQLDVNLNAPFRLTRAFLPEMLRRGAGRILFVSSISANLGSPQQAAYNASKAALVALMRCLAEELTDTGLMTAACLPGAIDTDMLVGSSYPPRMSADDVAKTLCFLADEASLAHNGGVTEMFGV
jgi:3-oxoacyl-[acyl-carrier protein] reductase